MPPHNSSHGSARGPRPLSGPAACTDIEAVQARADGQASSGSMKSLFEAFKRAEQKQAVRPHINAAAAGKMVHIVGEHGGEVWIVPGSARAQHQQLQQRADQRGLRRCVPPFGLSNPAGGVALGRPLRGPALRVAPPQTAPPVPLPAAPPQVQLPQQQQKWAPPAVAPSPPPSSPVLPAASVAPPVQVLSLPPAAPVAGPHIVKGLNLSAKPFVPSTSEKKPQLIHTSPSDAVSSDGSDGEVIVLRRPRAVPAAPTAELSPQRDAASPPPLQPPSPTYCHEALASPHRPLLGLGGVEASPGPMSPTALRELVDDIIGADGDSPAPPQEQPQDGPRDCWAAAGGDPAGPSAARCLLGAFAQPTIVAPPAESPPPGPPAAPLLQPSPPRSRPGSRTTGALPPGSPPRLASPSPSPSPPPPGSRSLRAQQRPPPQSPPGRSRVPHYDDYDRCHPQRQRGDPPACPVKPIMRVDPCDLGPRKSRRSGSSLGGAALSPDWYDGDRPAPCPRGYEEEYDAGCAARRQLASIEDFVRRNGIRRGFEEDSAIDEMARWG